MLFRSPLMAMTCTMPRSLPSMVAVTVLRTYPRLVKKPRNPKTAKANPMKPVPVRSERTKRFWKACKGSEMFPLKKTGEALKPPRQRRTFRRLTIQLSLGRVLLSRACLCFTGRTEIKEDRSTRQCRKSPPLPRMTF